MKDIKSQGIFPLITLKTFHVASCVGVIVASYVDVAVGRDRGVVVSVQVVLKFGFVHRRSLPCIFFFSLFPSAPSAGWP